MTYLKADGFDAAIIGIDSLSERIVYDKWAMVEILMIDDEMSEEDAVEFLEVNTWNAYVGDHTPIYVDVMKLDEILEFTK